MFSVPLSVFSIICKNPVTVKLTCQVLNRMKQNLMVFRKIAGQVDVHARLVNPIFKVEDSILQLLQQLLRQKERNPGNGIIWSGKPVSQNHRSPAFHLPGKATA